MKKLLITLAVALLWGCGDDNATEPTAEMPWVGRYAGSYAGDSDGIHIEIDAAVEVRRDLTCDFRLDFELTFVDEPDHTGTVRTLQCEYEIVGSSAVVDATLRVESNLYPPQTEQVHDTVHCVEGCSTSRWEAIRLENVMDLGFDMQLDRQ